MMRGNRIHFILNEINAKWLKFKIKTLNGVHNFTLFKILKNMSILISYIPLNTLTLNLNFLFKIDSIYFI